MIEVFGDVGVGYGPVADAFAENFADPGEDAAAVSLFSDGVKVVDVWAGTDVVSRRAMPADALMTVASCSKGITATVLAVLLGRGLLDPDALVTSYWPEFRAAGKDAVTVAMVASHTAGLPYPPLGTGLQGLDLQRGAGVTAALAGATPLWPPGTAMAYHPVTVGIMLDEIVKRATGLSVAAHLQSLIAEPLGLSMWMGLPEQFIDRVVPGVWEPTTVGEGRNPAPPPGSYADLRQQFLTELPPMDPDFADRIQVRDFYSAERPAAGAITDARSLAAMYAATLQPIDGISLFTDSTRVRVTAAPTDDVETLIESGTAGPDIRFGLGYQLSSPSMPGFGPHSYGHTGAGARLGLADPDYGIGFGYICSRMRNIGPGGDPRWKRLIDACITCLERA